MTKFTWQTPAEGRNILKLFDILGNLVATLVDESKPAGKYELEFNSRNLPSGVYFYQLNAGEYSAVCKMIILK